MRISRRIRLLNYSNKRYHILEYLLYIVFNVFFIGRSLWKVWGPKGSKLGICMRGRLIPVKLRRIIRPLLIPVLRICINFRIIRLMHFF